MAQHGGFWRRVAAYLIDWLIMAIAGGMISGTLLASFAGLVGFGENASAGPEALFTGTFVAIQLLSFVMNWLYFALLESSSLQGTLGKKALGMIVTDLEGRRISFWRATGRYFAKFLSILILFVGFIMAGLTERKQGLHDMIAGTLVYKAHSSAELDTSAAVFD